MNDASTPQDTLPDPDSDREPAPGQPAVSGLLRTPRWFVTAQFPHAADLAFQEVTYHVPLDGEQPIVTRVVVMTSEVIVRKARGREWREARGTVRRQEIEVERDEPGADDRLSLSDGTARA